jgi:hypothetical protein
MLLYVPTFSYIDLQSWCLPVRSITQPVVNENLQLCNRETGEVPIVPTRDGRLDGYILLPLSPDNQIDRKHTLPAVSTPHCPAKSIHASNRFHASHRQRSHLPRARITPYWHQLILQVPEVEKSARRSMHVCGRL